MGRASQLPLTQRRKRYRCSSLESPEIGKRGATNPPSAVGSPGAELILSLSSVPSGPVRPCRGSSSTTTLVGTTESQPYLAIRGQALIRGEASTSSSARAAHRQRRRVRRSRRSEVASCPHSGH